MDVVSISSTTSLSGLYWAIYNSNIFTVWGMVGSNRTIFAICGFDEIVQMIDDPAYNLEDELESTPIGAHPAEFLLARYSEESKVPVVAQMKYLDGSFREFQAPRSWTVLEPQIPSVVASTPTTFDIAILYGPWNRVQCLPQSVTAVRVKNAKNVEKFSKECEFIFPDGLLAKKNVFFRGLSLSSLELLMTFFLPSPHSNSAQNEFGPGIYVTDSFAYAKSYAGSNGAILVFKNPDFDGLRIWQPEGDEWKQLCAHWLKLPLRDITTSMPEQHRTAEVIAGPVSKVQNIKRGQAAFPVSDPHLDQKALVSYRSCERLSASLVAIIYIEKSERDY